MAESTKPKVAASGTSQKETATSKNKVIFTPLSKRQLKLYKEKLLALQKKTEKDVLVACRVAFVGTGIVDPDGIEISQVQSLFRRYYREFDADGTKILNYYLDKFVPKMRDALLSIENGTYGKCMLTGKNISTARLDEYLLATEAVENGEKAKAPTPSMQRIPSATVDKHGHYVPRDLKPARV
jgi:hypothetical protein